MSSRDYIFKTLVIIPAPLEKVFDFFSQAENLEKITPEFLNFRIEILPPEMKAGAQIAYRLNVHHLPVKWLTEVTVWEPPHRFVDSQIRGPYKKWVHEHRFAAVGRQTRMEDTVHYQLPFGMLGQLAHRLFVQKDVESIFKFREQVITNLFKQGA